MVKEASREASPGPLRLHRVKVGKAGEGVVESRQTHRPGTERRAQGQEAGQSVGWSVQLCPERGNMRGPGQGAQGACPGAQCTCISLSVPGGQEALSEWLGGRGRRWSVTEGAGKAAGDEVVCEDEVARMRVRMLRSSSREAMVVAHDGPAE